MAAATNQKALKDDHVTQVYEWLCQRTSTTEIMAKAVALGWGVKLRTIQRYVAAADEQRGMEAAKIRSRYLGKAIRIKEHIRDHALEVAYDMQGTKEGAQYLRIALAADEAICILLGLNEAARVELTLPLPWLEVFDEFGIRRPGDGKNSAHGGDDAPEVRH